MEDYLLRNARASAGGAGALGALQASSKQYAVSSTQ
jgi:hypothetical protein